MRDINSPVLLRVKKLRGRLSRCSKSRARKSQIVRTATHAHEIVVEVGHNAPQQDHQRDQAHDQEIPGH